MSVFVCLSGLPGVGKSTIAAELARRTGALWLRVDAIEQAMRGSDHAPGDLADIGYRALCGAAEGALAQGMDVIGDSVNPVDFTRTLYRSFTARIGARHLDVCVICSDRGAHRRRVEARGASVPGLAPPTWAMVRARPWEPFPDADLTLDTSRLSPAQAAAAIADRMEAEHG